MISIVDADPDLGDLLSPGDLSRARREAVTRVSRLSPGEWDAAAAQEPAEHHRGFLIVDGLLSRTVNVLGKHCVELVGHGDVMRPWSWGRGRLARARRDRLDGAGGEPPRRARPRARAADRPLAPARARALQPRRPSGPPS